MTADEANALQELMKMQAAGKVPRDFQLKMVQAQEERRDAMCQAATGMGKTWIAAGPYAKPENQHRVTLMVSPLIALQNEQVRVPIIICLVVTDFLRVGRLVQERLRC